MLPASCRCWLAVSHNHFGSTSWAGGSRSLSGQLLHRSLNRIYIYTFHFDLFSCRSGFASSGWSSYRHVIAGLLVPQLQGP